MVDGAVSSMSGQTSQPNLNSIVEALRGQPRDTGLDPGTLGRYSDYWELVRDFYRPFDSGPRVGETPRSICTRYRADNTPICASRRQPWVWGTAGSEVESTYAEVNRLFGDIVKVTPSSKVVGDLTLFLLAKGMAPEDLLQLDVKHDLALPNSVIDLFAGSLGTPPGRMAASLADHHLAGRRTEPHASRSRSAARRFRQDSEIPAAKAQTGRPP